MTLISSALYNFRVYKIVIFFRHFKNQITIKIYEYKKIEIVTKKMHTLADKIDGLFLEIASLGIQFRFLSSKRIEAAKTLQTTAKTRTHS